MGRNQAMICDPDSYDRYISPKLLQLTLSKVLFMFNNLHVLDLVETLSLEGDS